MDCMSFMKSTKDIWKSYDLKTKTIKTLKTYISKF